jgi:hypothetical protein
MSKQSVGSRAAKQKGAVSDSKRTQRGDRAEVAHIAAAEAASRAAERRDMVAIAAYFLAERRGFEPGHDVDDWLTAELHVAHARQLVM